MSEEVICPVDGGDSVIEHEAHRNGAAPKAKVSKRLTAGLGKLGLSACAVPGISLTNYRLNAQQKGWGAPCTGGRTTVTVSTGARVNVRNEIAELSRLIMQECIRRGYHIRPADTGAYNCRKISGTSTWSNHAWAIAIDINWQSNPYVRNLKTDMPSWMPALFNRYGFAWGGDYSGSKDAMHYEFMGTPAQAAAATELARRELTGGAPAQPFPVGDLESQKGESGPDVLWAQQRLSYWGFDPGAHDSQFGPATETAVKAFQRAKGLGDDGIVGAATKAKLAENKPAPPPPPSNVLQRGSKGDAVLRLQKRLAAHYPAYRHKLGNLVPDGDFGPQTEKWVREFQRKAGLAVDGIVGPATLRKLGL